MHLLSWLEFCKGIYVLDKVGHFHRKRFLKLC